jgi:hypothetical protein
MAAPEPPISLRYSISKTKASSEKIPWGIEVRRLIAASEPSESGDS